MPRDSGVFGSRRDRLEARCAAADANADAASTGDKLSRIAAIRARGSGGDSKTFRSLMPRAPGAKWSPSRKSTCGATPTTIDGRAARARGRLRRAFGQEHYWLDTLAPVCSARQS